MLLQLRSNASHLAAALALLLILILSFSSSAEGQNNKNLLLNGSFEEGSNVGSFRTLKKGDMIPGWEVMKATVDLNGNYFVAYDGHKAIDLNGTPGLGAIEQRFFTKKGERYLLTFFMAGNPAGGPAIKKMNVYAGDQVQLFEFDVTGKTTSDMGWVKCEMVFKATGHKTALRFESLPDYEPTNYGPAIDMVSVVPTKKRSGVKEGNGGLFQLDYGILTGLSKNFVGDNLLELVNYDANRYNLDVSNVGLGFHLGVFGCLHIGPVLVQPELRLNTHRIEYTLYANANQVANERYQYFDIPLLIGYQYRFLKAYMGPSAHFYLFKIGGLDDLGDFSSGVRRFTYGYEFGIGADLGFIGIDLRYAGNLDRFGDGLMFNGERKIYLTDQPDKLMIIISIPIN